MTQTTLALLLALLYAVLASASESENKHTSDIPAYMEERVLATKHPEFTTVPLYAFVQVLWNTPQQLTQAVASQALSLAGVSGAPLIGSFLGRGADIAADSLRLSEQEVISGALLSNSDLLIVIPALIAANINSGISSRIMQQMWIRNLLTLGYSFYQPGSSILSSFVKAAVPPGASRAAPKKQKIEFVNEELSRFVDITWQERPERLHKSEFKITFYPEHLNCSNVLDCNDDTLTCSAKQLACQWPSSQVHIRTYIHQWQEQTFRVFQPCQEESCGNLYALEHEPEMEFTASCSLEQLIHNLLGSPIEPETSNEYEYNFNGYGITSHIETAKPKLTNGCLLVNPAPLNASSLSLINKLVREWPSFWDTESNSSDNNLLMLDSGQPSPVPSYVEPIGALTKVQLDESVALIVDISDDLTPRISLTSEINPDLSQRLHSLESQWGGNQLYFNQLKVNLLKFGQTFFHLALVNVLSQQSSMIFDRAAEKATNHLIKTPASSTEETAGHKSSSGADDTSVNSRASNDNKPVKNLAANSENNGLEGGGNPPDKDRADDPAGGFDPRCEECSTPISEESFRHGITTCYECMLSDTEAMFQQRSTENDRQNTEKPYTALPKHTIKEEFPSTASCSENKVSAYDALTTTGHSASNGLQEETNKEYRSRVIQLVEEERPPETEITKTLALDGIDSEQGSSHTHRNTGTRSLWNRFGLKEVAKPLSSPYEVKQFSNNEPYEEDIAPSSPFPRLKTTVTTKDLKAEFCKASGCFSMIDSADQPAHNKQHYENFLSQFDTDSTNEQPCPWCKTSVSKLTLTYHLRDSHPDLVFGLSQLTPMIDAIDLFSGIGGLSMGLEQAGIKVAAGYDIDGSCKLSYEMNHEGKFVEADISGVKGSDLKQYFTPGNAHVLVAGVPCVTYSLLSNTKHSDENKFLTLNHFKRIIFETWPNMFVMENVPNIANKHSHGFHSFIKSLESVGYHITPTRLLASEYGVPQHRPRLFIFGSLYGRIELPEPLNPLDDSPTLRDAIDYLPKLNSGKQHDFDPMHIANSLTEKTTDAIRYSPIGYQSSWQQWPKEIQERFNTEKWFQSIYGRMEYDEPAHTVTTNGHLPGSGSYTHPDPEQNRGYTLRELANIQGFPRNMMLNYKAQPVEAEAGLTSGNLQGKNNINMKTLRTASRHIGNAVPPPLGKAVGLTLIKHLEEMKKQGKFPRRLSHYTPGPDITVKEGAASSAKRSVFVCPVKNCESKKLIHPYYTVPRASDWFDHLVSKHGGGYPFKETTARNMHNLGEAVSADQRQLTCSLNDCSSTPKTFESFEELGFHLKHEHSSTLDSLTLTDLYRNQRQHATTRQGEKPLSQMSIERAGQRYQTRHGKGFVCQEHPDTVLAQNPEALGRHWFSEHMQLKYFCPSNSCEQTFDSASALYKHWYPQKTTGDSMHVISEHGTVYDANLDFSPLMSKEVQVSSVPPSSQPQTTQQVALSSVSSPMDTDVQTIAGSHFNNAQTPLRERGDISSDPLKDGQNIRSFPAQGAHPVTSNNLLAGVKRPALTTLTGEPPFKKQATATGEADIIVAEPYSTHTATGENLVMYNKIMSEGNWECPYYLDCGRDRGALVTHLKENHCKMRFKCVQPGCKSSYSDISSMRSHMISLHPEEDHHNFALSPVETIFPLADSWHTPPTKKNTASSARVLNTPGYHWQPSARLNTPAQPHHPTTFPLTHYPLKELQRHSH